jgi:hypothetical protein
MQVSPNAPDAASGAARRLVLRNTLYLTVSQVLTVPLAVFSNAVAAHYLGPEVFGYAYLAGTLCGFGFLAVGWGHEAVLPAVISRLAKPLGPFVAAPLSLLAYAGALWLTGGVDENQVATIRSTIGRGLSRAVPGVSNWL